MAHTEVRLEDGRPKVVGSFGNAAALGRFAAHEVLEASDIVEIRLDILQAENAGCQPAAWKHLAGVPLLFTARSQSEGGALPLSARERSGLLELAMDDASLVDIEVESIPQMHACIADIARRGIPWIASSHHFTELPAEASLRNAVAIARSAGASVFKLAAMMKAPSDLARLADFQLTDHGIPVATMGMGPLAPVSRLLCAQCGSILNYGYLGDVPTAPGQWDSASLKQAIAKLVPFPS